MYCYVLVNNKYFLNKIQKNFYHNYNYKKKKNYVNIVGTKSVDKAKKWNN